MRKVGSKNTLEFEKKIEYLESRLKLTDDLIENIISGNIEKAKKSLHSTNETEFNLLNNLVEKFSDTRKDHQTYSLLKVIIESMPFPIFIKDENAKYIIINSFEAKLFGLSESKIIGKHDSDFIQNKEELAIIQKSDRDVLIKNKSIQLPNQNFSLSNGKSYVFKTHKTPFINPISGKRNILGFSVDVTDSINLYNLRSLIISKL